MLSIQLKIISHRRFDYFTYFRKSGMSLHLNSNLILLHRSVYKKNKNDFYTIKKIINDYISSHKNVTGNKFNELSLWQIADSKDARNRLPIILSRDTLLLSLFEDVDDLVHLSKKIKSLKVLDRLSHKNVVHRLQTKIQTSGILKICISHGANLILDILSDKYLLKKLLDRLGIDGLIKVASQSGAGQSLYMILDDDYYPILLKRLGKENLIRVAGTDGAKQVLQLFIDTTAFDLLTKRLGPENLIKSASIHGAKQSLNMIINNKSYQKLVDRLGEHKIPHFLNNCGAKPTLDFILNDQYFETLKQALGFEGIIKIASRSGSRKVFDIVLNKDSFNYLLTYFSKEEFIKIACQGGARQVFDLFLDKNILQKLHDLLGKDGILKISSRGGARPIFDLILNDDFYQLLLERIGKSGLITISSHGGATPVLELILNDKKYQELYTLLGKENLIKVARNYGSRQCLEYILNPNIRDTLIERLEKEGFLRVATQGGAKLVFDLILDNKTFNILLKRIGREGIIKVSNHDGSRKVLDLILNNEKFAPLIDFLGKDNFIRIAKNAGSLQVFDLFLKTKTREKLLTYFDKETLFNVASHTGASNLFNLILDSDIYQQLLHTIGRDILKKISYCDGAKHILDLVLQKDKFEYLTALLGKEVLFELITQEGSRQVLDILMDENSYTILLQRIGKKDLNLILIIPYISPILRLVIDSKKWEIIESILGGDKFIDITLKRKFTSSIIGMISNYDTLKRFLSPDSLYKYALLSTKNQKGLDSTSLDILINQLKFKEDDVMNFAKLSGRFIPYILDLIMNSEQKIRRLFQKNAQRFLLRHPHHSKINLNYSMLPESDKRLHCIIALVELNHYCNSEPLSLEELQFFIDHNHSFFSNNFQFLWIRRMLRITGHYTSNERKKLYVHLLNDRYFLLPLWVLTLSSLNAESRKWFIENGKNYIRSMILPLHSNLRHPPQHSPLEESYLLRCLQDKNIREMISLSYHKEFQTIDYSLHDLVISSDTPQLSILSKKDHASFQPIDWIQLIIKIYNKLDLSHIGIKTSFPKILLRKGCILVNLAKDLLHSLFDSNSELSNHDSQKVSLIVNDCDHSQMKPPVKRQLSSATYPPEKKSRANTSSETDDDITFDNIYSIPYALSLLDQDDWDALILNHSFPEIASFDESEETTMHDSDALSNYFHDNT